MAESRIIPIPSGVNATTLAAPDAGDTLAGNTLAVQNVGTVPVLVGGVDVAVANGWPIAVGASLILDVAEDLFAVVAGGTSGSVALLRVK